MPHTLIATAHSLTLDQQFKRNSLDRYDSAKRLCHILKAAKHDAALHDSFIARIPILVLFYRQKPVSQGDLSIVLLVFSLWWNLRDAL
jgi:hypothetical protein